jgi:hypothetical protein
MTLTLMTVYKYPTFVQVNTFLDEITCFLQMAYQILQNHIMRLDQLLNRPRNSELFGVQIWSPSWVMDDLEDECNVVLFVEKL